MKLSITIFAILLVNFTFSQRITNLILIDENGITEDAEKATSFIVIKQYPDSHFERLDYKKAGPLNLLRSYKDDSLKILDGKYLEYMPNGTIKTYGQYLNNQKFGNWRTFNDTGKVIQTTKYDHDTIVYVDNMYRKDTLISYPDEREAEFPGGDKAWRKYLIKSLEKSQTADKAFKGGTAYINFTVATDGSIQDIFISKSAEFVIDEESIQIIQKSPKWIPAFQNGRNVNAYRRQPLTFIK